MTHVARPALERACECENAELRNRTPNAVAISQNSRCKKPIHASDSVDCENSQATGAKPISKIVISISSPATMPKISTSRAFDPLRHAKMYRLGRQMSAEMSRPQEIFSGAAYH